MNPLLLVGVGVLALLQLIAALQVLRASEQAGLTGLGRIMPVILTLLIPILGPWVGARATGAGTRPLLLSLVGSVVCGALALAVPTTPPGPQVAHNVPAVDGQPAVPTDEAAPEAADAAAPAEAEEAPEVVAEPTAEAASEPTAETVEVPAEATPAEPAAGTPPVVAAPVATPAGSAILTPVGQPLPGAAPAVEILREGAVPAVPGTQASVEARLAQPARFSGQIQITPTQSGGKLTFPIAATRWSNVRLEFAAKYGTVPEPYRWMGNSTPMLYLGGRAWSFNEAIDGFSPTPVADAQIVDGARIVVASMAGGYLAEVQFSGVKTGPEGQLEEATLDVQIH